MGSHPRGYVLGNFCARFDWLRVLWDCDSFLHDHLRDLARQGIRPLPATVWPSFLWTLWGY